MQTTPEDDKQATAEQKAAEAAEALGSEGAAVTARAVRARSGVRMTVAAEAARTWNEAEANAAVVPDPPAAVETRFAALWREAVTAARAEHAEAKAGWQAKLDQSDAERRTLAEEVEQLEGERDEARNERDEANRETDRLREQGAAAASTAAEALAEQRSRADRAEARAEAVERERDRLLQERQGLLAERDELRDALGSHKH